MSIFIKYDNWLFSFNFLSCILYILIPLSSSKYLFPFFEVSLFYPLDKDSSKKYQEIPVLPKDLKEVEGVNPDTHELDSVRIAMDSEKDAIDYYTDI